MLWVFVGYFALTMGLGFWRGTKTKSQEDFVLGGSKLPGWMLALSERATGESAWLLLGLTGFVYSNGLSGIWIAVGCLMGISTAWIVLARRFRQEAARYQTLTMPEYFSVKFAQKAATIRTLSTLIISFFFVFYVSAQFAGAGKTIESTFGVDPTWGQIISAAVVMTYASFGGFMSVVAVDVLQAILMITTLVVAPTLMLVELVATPVSLSSALAAADPSLGSLTGGATGFAAGLVIFNNFAWFFGYLGGQPHLSARFMAMPDDRQVAIGRNIAVAWTVLAYGGAIAIGLCSLALFGPNAVRDPEMVLPYALTSLFPPWLAAVLLAGAVAAMVSTAQSMLIVAGTSISQDTYQGLMMKGRAPDRTVLRVSRVATFAIGLFGLILAFTTEQLVYSIVSYAWAGIGCSFAPAVLLSFYWDRFNSAGVVTALLVGLTTTTVWIATGLDTVVTSMAVTFFASMSAAILVVVAPRGKGSADVAPAVRVAPDTQ